MDYRDVLIKVLADLKAAEVPDDLREVAFTLGVKMLVGGPSSPSVQTSLLAPPPQLKAPALGTPPTIESPGALLSTRLGIEYEDIVEVFNFAETGPELVIGSGRLPSATAAATKQIAVLVTAARQGIGLEEWTSFASIREACHAYGRLDTNNFASTMKEIEGYFSVRTPSPRKREVKLNRPGWEHASELVAELVGR